jgi:hypothetical protein
VRAERAPDSSDLAVAVAGDGVARRQSLGQLLQGEGQQWQGFTSPRVGDELGHQLGLDPEPAAAGGLLDHHAQHVAGQGAEGLHVDPDARQLRQRQQPVL